MNVTLTVTEGPHVGRVFVFSEHDTFIVGRSKDAHFRLPVKDKTISRFHFLVEVNPPSCRLLDMASTNGTTVNGRKVQWADLKHGDVLVSGRTTLVLAIENDAANTKTLTNELSSFTYPTRDDLPAQQTIADSGKPFSLAKYRLLRELGRGGMGIVHLAETEAEMVHVAVKTITPSVAGSQATLVRFLREASILRRLDHPNIVKFLEIGLANGQYYFVMEYVAGVDSSQYVKQFDGRIPIGRAVSMAIQALDGLAYAHALGYVHRDIKPNNLLVVPLNGHELVKLADFGLARTYQASPLSGLTLAGHFAGTSGYLAPEQITNFRESKPTSDIYALAATLYFLLTGMRPYDLPSTLEGQILVILQDDPIPIRTKRPEIPEALAAVIHKALARVPSARYEDAQAMREALFPFKRLV